MNTLEQAIIHSINTAMIYSNPPKFRKHLGASLIGDACSRKVWYSFRWSKQIHASGRLLRLWQRGHREEDFYRQLLRQAGWKIEEYDTRVRVSDIEGHFGGELDDIGIPPEALQNQGLMPRVLLEYKTSNKSGFAKLLNGGIGQAQPKHVIQTQIYAALYGVSQIVYLAVNKDNDDLFCAVLNVDKALVEQELRKAQDIITTQAPPQKLSDEPTFWQCKICDYHHICHNNEPPAKNCRTCINSLPDKDGSWTCNFFRMTIPEDFIERGCDNYRRLF